MSISTVDGTIETAEIRRTGPGIVMYRSIVIRQPNGEAHEIKKPVTHSDLATLLQPGTSGRFYVFSAVDHRGINGVRASDGRAVFAHPKNNERIALFLTIFAIVALAVSAVLFDRISFWFVILIVLGPVLWVISRNARQQGELKFNADSAYRPPAIA